MTIDRVIKRPIGQVPINYGVTSTPVGTTSATFEDATSAVPLTLLEPSTMIAVATFECATISGASPSVIAFAMDIDGTDSQELQRYLAGSNDQGLGSLVYYRTGRGPGVITAKLRFRRVSGSATPGINAAHLFVMAL